MIILGLLFAVMAIGVIVAITITPRDKMWLAVLLCVIIILLAVVTVEVGFTVIEMRKINDNTFGLRDAIFSIRR